MTQGKPKKPPKIPPKWVVVAFLINALCLFAAAFMIITHNGAAAITLALLSLVPLLAGSIGYACAPRRQPGPPQVAPQGSQAGPITFRSAILPIGFFIAFVAAACVLGLVVKALLPAPAPVLELRPAAAIDADALEYADSEFERGEYAHALELLTPFAQRGNGHAQAMLAKIYLGQTGVPRNEALAKQWAEKSAAQDHPDGLILLSSMYLNGDGVPKDATQAMALIRRGVALDNAQAKAQLGLMFVNGIGTETDLAEGRKWITASAKQGHFGAQVALGRLVLNEGTRLGASVPIGGSASAEAQLPPVSASVKQAAEAGDAAAQLALGRALYTQALFVSGDVDQALPWLEKSAASGNAMAQFAAGALYIDGTHGVPYNAARAQEWFNKGVAQLP